MLVWMICGDLVRTFNQNRYDISSVDHSANGASRTICCVLLMNGSSQKHAPHFVDTFNSWRSWSKSYIVYPADMMPFACSFINVQCSLFSDSFDFSSRLAFTQFAWFEIWVCRRFFFSKYFFFGCVRLARTEKRVQCAIIHSLLGEYVCVSERWNVFRVALNLD